MRDIYSKANNVLVWLGKASVDCDLEYSDLGIDYLHRLGCKAIERGEADPWPDDRFTGPLYSGLRELMQSRYGRRHGPFAGFSRPNDNSLLQLLETCLGN
jgi:hypothetical protein